MSAPRAPAGTQATPPRSPGGRGVQAKEGTGSPWGHSGGAGWGGCRANPWRRRWQAAQCKMAAHSRPRAGEHTHGRACVGRTHHRRGARGGVPLSLLSHAAAGHARARARARPPPSPPPHQTPSPHANTQPGQPPAPSPSSPLDPPTLSNGLRNVSCDTSLVSVSMSATSACRSPLALAVALGNTLRNNVKQVRKVRRRVVQSPRGEQEGVALAAGLAGGPPPAAARSLPRAATTLLVAMPCRKAPVRSAARGGCRATPPGRHLVGVGWPANPALTLPAPLSSTITGCEGDDDAMARK